MKILSICIPTYNRKDCLKQCIDSIVNQSVFSEIEVVISDNSSNTETAEMMEVYIGKYPNIIYSKNNENIGFDKNVLKVISIASGKYCGIIGDDDAFFENSLGNIISILQQQKAEYYIANTWSYDSCLVKPIISSASLDIKEDISYPTLKEFVFSLQPKKVQTVCFFGAMSGQFFLKEKWDSFPSKEKFIGTQTIHLFVLLSSMRDSPFMLVSSPTIQSRSDNLRWDTFGLGSAIKREKVTLNTFQFIAGLYQIPYSKTHLYGIFIGSYIKNLLIFYTKKYLIRDQATISKIKILIGKFSKN